MSNQSNLRENQQIVNGLHGNPVAKLAYSETAFNNNDVNGVDNFDLSAENNIPKEHLTEYNPTVLLRGVRTQGASIPRMAINHFFGRTS